jgi:maltose alpha-D-glucosyltransferase/alpha-amylase
LWLLPLYPSPGLDHGYDVTDYYNVAPALGTLGDFVEFSHQARLRGLRLTVDLPINHTSAASVVSAGPMRSLVTV